MCVNISGCSVGVVVWEIGAWRLIGVLDAVARCLRSPIDVSPFPFGLPFVECSRFKMAMMMQSACVMVDFVMCPCCNKNVSDTLSELVFLTWQMCAR